MACELTSRRVFIGLAAFALVVLVPFTAHRSCVHKHTLEDLMLAHTERTASSPAGHFLSTTGWRLYDALAPLGASMRIWLWRTFKARRTISAAC